ncbi:2-oxoglutarate and oxygenase superfamily protein [Perilla frutescens var. frutescens]|nr:2-oxoglutarate and oxygenase superfamily protein [Perilla frutescens var. frutescens]
MEEILELYELQYADLMALFSDQNPPSNEEIQRLESISRSIMQNLGRSGPGLLSISGVPQARNSQTLLPLARKLALLNNDDRKRILKDHNLGSDVPLKNLDRIVSSFAMQMKYDDEFGFKFEGSEMVGDGEFKDLGFAFRELGFCMMELGLCLARVCDKQIGGCELEQSLLQCGTAKGRLIHYHSVADNVAIKEAANRKRGSRGSNVNLRENRRFDVDDNDDGGGDGSSKLWQQWHYDYGVFTVLTTPMFMLSNGSDEQECGSPSGHTYLQVFHPETNSVVMVRASRGSFIVQVGESADVLSRGRLRATLHSVGRPAKMENLSRETFVVFLQPAWSRTFSLADYPVEVEPSCNEETGGARHELNGLTRKILEIVPPLSSRLRDGMTFAEFSKETTKQYYGGRGLQPNR